MKKYIITDPCYLLNDEEWDKCCELIKDQEWSDIIDKKFSLQVREILDSITNHGFTYAASTIIGDWVNEISGNGVIQSEFCADAGMVCICEFTDTIKERVANHRGRELHESCYGLFEAGDTIRVHEDESEGQLVLRICDNEGHEFNTIDPLDYNEE